MFCVLAAGWGDHPKAECGYKLHQRGANHWCLERILFAIWFTIKSKRACSIIGDQILFVHWLANDNQLKLNKHAREQAAAMVSKCHERNWIHWKSEHETGCFLSSSNLKEIHKVNHDTVEIYLFVRGNCAKWFHSPWSQDHTLCMCQFSSAVLVMARGGTVWRDVPLVWCLPNINCQSKNIVVNIKDYASTTRSVNQRTTRIWL